MKRLILATLFFCVCSSSVALAMDLDSGSSSKKSGFSSLKTILKAGLLGLVLFSGNTEALQCHSRTITYFPYQPTFPESNQWSACRYFHRVNPCDRSSEFSCSEQTELVCERYFEEEKCSAVEVCDGWKECTVLELLNHHFPILPYPISEYKEETRSLDEYLDQASCDL